MNNSYNLLLPVALFVLLLILLGEYTQKYVKDYRSTRIVKHLQRPVAEK